MNDDSNAAGGPHWRYWVIVMVALIFNIAGIVNFIAQMDASAVATMPDAYRAIVENRPTWGTWSFALAVFGGGLGCVLLLLRKSVAFYVFIASLMGAVVAQLPFVGMTGFPVEALIGGLTQVIVTVFLMWYSTLAERKRWID